jgi:glutaredoxin
MAAKSKHLLTLFGARNCCLCEEAKAVLKSVNAKVPQCYIQIPFDLHYIDIHSPSCSQEFNEYKFDIPVLHINGKYFKRHRFAEEDLISALNEE